MRFNMAVHTLTGRSMVEVFDNADRFVGAIYPDDEGNAVKIVSRYFNETDPVPMISGLGSAAPSLTIHFPRAP